MEFDSLAALQDHFETEHGGPGAIEGLVTYFINGDPFVAKVEDNWTLAYVLRNKIGFTGSKRACDTGDCGLCTVIVNDRPILSCMMLAVEANGANIETVEGLANDGELSKLQQAFIDNDAMQCGFCTPAQILTAKALLDFNANPSTDEIKEFMAGTLCRCGAHPNIVKAVMAAK
ncbi:MAG: (2Fe-2S)-binding protein [Dehalococcoidia bacterium]|nr:MAG: (2Fe-2S)-binding protein [Dehalococcoidia bacterium]